MRIVHASTTDVVGGAARGTYALHRTLLEMGVDSRMLVAIKESEDPAVQRLDRSARIRWKLARELDQRALGCYSRRRRATFTPALYSSGALRSAGALSPDLLHLHWVGGGFLRPEDLRHVEVPTVWTVRDMWPFTGGCHYSDGCSRFTSGCGQCPALGSTGRLDLSSLLVWRKQRAWRGRRLTLVAISHWLADEIRRSRLLGEAEVEVIHNGIDPERFRPTPPAVARRILGWPEDRRVVLYGAMNATRDARKGFDHFLAALAHARERETPGALRGVVFGGRPPSGDNGRDIDYLGRLHDDLTLALVYSAADVMVVPSTEEAFGKTAAEALACETPVVCFDTSGLREVVDHGVTGYRARCFDDSDLAEGIAFCLGEPGRAAQLGARGRESVMQRFTVTTMARRYRSLYERLLAETADGSRRP